MVMVPRKNSCVNKPKALLTKINICSIMNKHGPVPSKPCLLQGPKKPCMPRQPSIAGAFSIPDFVGLEESPVKG